MPLVFRVADDESVCCLVWFVLYRSNYLCGLFVSKRLSLSIFFVLCWFRLVGYSGGFFSPGEGPIYCRFDSFKNATRFIGLLVAHYNFWKVVIVWLPRKLSLGWETTGHVHRRCENKRFVAKFVGDALRADGNMLFGIYCEKNVVAERKSQVVQHIT